MVFLKKTSTLLEEYALYIRGSFKYVLLILQIFCDLTVIGKSTIFMSLCKVNLTISADINLMNEYIVKSWHDRIHTPHFRLIL